MKKIVMVVHGGASEETPFIKKYIKEHEEGLIEAVQAGYAILKEGGKAVEAVEKAVMLLEDNPYFNAGKGSALNSNGEVEMDASIMDGKKLKAGAVSMVRGVKNPIVLARVVMTKTKHVFLSGYGAIALAPLNKVVLEPESYFMTEHQYEDYLAACEKEKQQSLLKKKLHGTVGAVALDEKGNLAAATSTGGTSHCLPGRIGDSCVVGAGCYADNSTCAVSGTGEGESLIVGVTAHTIAMLIDLKQLPLQAACDDAIHQRNKKITGDTGVIAVDPDGNIGISFNTEVMKRAWIGLDQAVHVKIY